MFQIQTDETNHSFFIVNNQYSTAFKLFGHTLLPYEAYDLIIFTPGHDLNKIDLPDWPDSCDHIVLNIVQVFSVTTTGILNSQQIIG
jgi:hypothetical protein